MLPPLIALAASIAAASTPELFQHLCGRPQSVEVIEQVLAKDGWSSFEPDPSSGLALHTDDAAKVMLSHGAKPPTVKSFRRTSGAKELDFQLLQHEMPDGRSLTECDLIDGEATSLPEQSVLITMLPAPFRRVSLLGADTALWAKPFGEPSSFRVSFVAKEGALAQQLHLSGALYVASFVSLSS